SNFDVEDEIKAQNAKEIKLNSSSAYEILDIKMYDIIIGKDTLSEFKTHHAEHEMHLAEIHLHERLSKAGANEAEAKVELLKAKAQLHIGMAEGLKTGTFKYNDLQKYMLMTEDEDDSKKHELGKESNSH
ncbi:MAG: flotillin-like FloA family protein, partial [Bacteroidota bacterium]|nr:flotillin-like FloA family protein [Bacteroidota bacterium]